MDVELLFTALPAALLGLWLSYRGSAALIAEQRRLAATGTVPIIVTRSRIDTISVPSSVGVLDLLYVPLLEFRYQYGERWYRSDVFNPDAESAWCEEHGVAEALVQEVLRRNTAFVDESGMPAYLQRELSPQRRRQFRLFVSGGFGLQLVALALVAWFTHG